MDVLEPWLAATIEGELGEALRRREDGTARVQLAGYSRGLPYDDSSNLRIPSRKKGPIVQITKFLTFEESIQVTLSDSVIRVNAWITNHASQLYARQNKKRLTEDTLGGLIQLQEFEIVATHLGPRNQRLTLYVTDFKSIGANGSGEFGVPQAIESREETKELLKKLADLRKHESDAHSEHSTTPSSVRSQRSTQTSEVGNAQLSQTGFATQIPRYDPPPVSKSKRPDTNISINTGSTSTANRAQSLASTTKGTSGNFLASALNPPQIQAAPHRPSLNGNKTPVNSAADLFGLIPNAKRASPAPIRISEPMIEQPSGRTTASIVPDIIQGENEASRDITLAASDENVSRAPVGPHKRKRSSPNDAQRKKAADHHEISEVDKDRDSSAANLDPDNKASSGSAATETSINTIYIRPATASRSNAVGLNPKAPLRLSIGSISKLTSSASGQNIGRNRISSRDVKIPKDQETLLNRADSWLPAEVGQFEPSANIPISLLKALNEKADIRVQQSMKLRKQRNGAMSPVAVIDKTPDSESDVPVSSGQWPASPELDQLPPDSSVASAEHSDHSFQRKSDSPHSVLSSRRQSQASASSHSIPSRRPSLISIQRFSRESGFPSVVSPGLSSPSFISTSAGEDVHRFTCQAPGCGKSYKTTSGLKYHVDRHHPSTGSVESFKCPLKDCTKSYASPGGLKYHIERHHGGNTARASRSGSATSTIPGASTPMFPGLKSWSERDGESERKVVDSGADDESDSVEGLASMPPFLRRGSRNPRDEGNVGLHPSPSFVLSSNPPPDAQLALAQSTTTNPDETHAAIETYSSLLPASPTPESDLEMTVPLALNEKTDSIASSAPMRRFPSTASQPQDPFTQVKRTPYVNARVQNRSLPDSRTLSSPLKASFGSLTNSTMNYDTESVSASIVSGPEVSTTETRGGTGSVNVVEDHGIGYVAARLARESNSEEVTDSILERTDKFIAKVQSERIQAAAAADEPDDSSITMTESRGQSLALNQPSVVTEVIAMNQAIPETLPTSVDNHAKTSPDLFTSEHTAQTVHEMKRKVADSSVESPSVVKRQKRFKVPPELAFTERSEVPRDPSEGVRQFRQDFLTSRRGSESSTPAMSPTKPFTGRTGNLSKNPRDPSERARQFRQDFLISRRNSESSTPAISPTKPFTIPTWNLSENPRDPSERARQFRQEFLNSRRSSETSTPTISPQIPCTALTGTIQADRRSSEVAKSSENLTVQSQSTYSGIEHENTNELKDTSAKSQRQEMEFNAAPVIDDPASLESDGDNAKPGAQDHPSFDCETESLMFVAQNTDVRGSHSKQSTVIKASSYAADDEVKRAQSVDLDISLNTSGHIETENDLANANDDTDQIVDPGVNLVVASRDELAKTNEDSPVESKPYKACGDLPVGADGIAEQKSNTWTPEAILDKSDKARTAALEPVHPYSIQENAEFQNFHKIGSEHKPQTQSIRVDADTPMPDFQVDQDIASMEPIAHMSEPTNTTTTLSLAVTTLAPDSNTANQPHITSAAVEPAISLGTPMSDSEVRSVEEYQNPAQLPIGANERNPLSVPQNIFDRFQAMYPAYSGDIKHFAAVCRKISQLVKADRMEHQSLWDDFIVRHKIEYHQYLQRCAEEAEDAVPYEEFYQTEIEEPRYKNRVINRRNLDEALALVARRPNKKKAHVEPFKDRNPRTKNAEKVHREPVKDDESRLDSSDPDSVVEKMHYEQGLANDGETLELVETKSAPKLATCYEIAPKPSESQVTLDFSAEKVRSMVSADDEPRVELAKTQPASMEATSTRLGQTHSESRVIIDLTEDDPPDDQPKRMVPQSSPPQPINGISVEPPPLQYSRDASGSLYKVPYTHPTMSPPQPSIRSPSISATASKKGITKSNRRSLPWKESGHSVLRSSTEATASDSPNRSPVSELREAHTKESSNVNSRPSAKISPKGAEQSQRLLDTCHRVIQSNWGIKAHELLEPEYHGEQVLSESMMELLAEIASKVNVREARHRIKKAIDTRNRDSARLGAGHPSQDRMILKSDLERVRGAVETSSMSTTSPFSLPRTNTAVEKQNGGSQSEWWEDDNSPFKSFARAYASIRAGNGNSFAKADSAEPGGVEKGLEGLEAGSSGVQLRKIDIMRWKL